jgi:putative oxidoreductase
MDVVELAGRIVFAAIFLDYGFTHLRQRAGMVAFAKSFDAPAPEITVPLSGVMMVLGGLAVALGVWPDVGALLIILFLLPAAFVAHAYWRESDEGMRAVQRAQFWKNISLVGAALFIFGIAVDLGDDLPLTLVGPLFG